MGSDGRSDLFSLGVIFYAMVVGHSPFQGDSATTVCFKVANREPVPASALDLNLPRELDAVIARAMAKDPRKRYQRGAEFAEAVAELRILFMNRTGTVLRTGTETLTTARAISGSPALGLSSAAKIVRAHILRSPLKDIGLGVATIIMLLIVGVQTKLLVLTHDQNPSNTAAIAYHTDQTADRAGQPAVPPATARVNPPAKASTVASARRPWKITRNPIPRPRKEVVVPLSTVELAVRHQFKDATLSLVVDGKLALTRQLHGGTQKRLVVFSGVRGMESETLQIPAGQHVLRLRAQTADQTVDLSKTISADLVGGSDKTLAISFDKHNTSMLVAWQ